MKKILLSLCALLAIAGKAAADDAFTVGNITLPQNGEADVVVKFSLDAGSTCSGYTFWLQVPEELAFVTTEKNGKTNISYTVGDCYDETPTLTPNLDEGFLKVGCLTANSDPINGPTGVLVTFKVKANAAVSIGDVYTGTLTKGTISAENGSVHNVADATFTITIGAPEDPYLLLDETSTTVPEEAANVDVRVKRTINANEWSTLVLPFDMTEAQVKEAFGSDVELAEYIEHEMNDEGTAISVFFDDANLAVDGLMANNPYIIRTSKDITEFTVDGVTIDPDEEGAIAEFTNGRSGSRKEVYGTFRGTYHAQTVVPENCLFLNESKFWYSKGLTKMKAFRAYFDFVDVLASVEQGAGARITMSFVDGDATGIRDNNREAMTNDRYYDLQGRSVRTPAKGIYVRDGKKVVIK